MSCTPSYGGVCWSPYMAGCGGCGSAGTTAPTTSVPSYSGIIGFSNVLGVACYTSFVPGCETFQEGNTGYQQWYENIFETYVNQWYPVDNYVNNAGNWQEIVAGYTDGTYYGPYNTYWDGDAGVAGQYVEGFWNAEDGYVGPYSGYAGVSYVNQDGTWNGNTGGVADPYIRQFVDPNNGYRWTGNYPYRLYVDSILGNDRRQLQTTPSYLDTIFSAFVDPYTNEEFVDNAASIGLDIAEDYVDEYPTQYVNEDGSWNGHIYDDIDLDIYIGTYVDPNGMWTGWAGPFTGGYNPESWDWQATVANYSPLAGTPEKRQSKVIKYLKKFGVLGMTPQSVGSISAKSLVKRYRPKNFFKTLRYLKEEDLTATEYATKVLEHYQAYASTGHALELARKYSSDEYTAFIAGMYEEWLPAEVRKNAAKYTPLKGDDLDEFVSQVIADYNPIKLNTFLNDLGLGEDLTELLSGYVSQGGDASGYVGTLGAAGSSEESSASTAAVAAGSAAAGAGLVGAAMFIANKKSQDSTALAASNGKFDPNEL